MMRQDAASTLFVNHSGSPLILKLPGNVHGTTLDYEAQKTRRGKYSRQKTAISLEIQGVRREHILSTSRFPEEYEARAGGKYSKKP
jgi:hypothetical protein